MDTFITEVAKITHAILSELIPHVLARSVEIVSECEKKAAEREVPCKFRDKEDCANGLRFPDDCLECLSYKSSEPNLLKSIPDILVRYMLVSIGHNRSN